MTNMKGSTNSLEPSRDFAEQKNLENASHLLANMSLEVAYSISLLLADTVE